MGKGGCAGPGSSASCSGGLVRAVLLAISSFAEAKTASGFTQRNTCHQKQGVRASKCHEGGIDREEVARHASEESCWVVVKDRVYDVTEFGHHHPGGQVIFQYGGRDATDVFAAFHSPEAWATLSRFHIGDLANPAPPSALMQDFRKLRHSFIKEGLFKVSSTYYAMKFASNFALLATAMALLLAGSRSLLSMVSSALLLALFWQQTGWLSHDYLHHQVMKNRAFGTAMGYFQGNLLQGFSVDWWKRKHNTHHAVPNELDENNNANDPDIDTLPFLAWSEEQLQTTNDAVKALLRHQHWFFFPILLGARFMWAQQSMAHAIQMAKVSATGRLELSVLLLHYGWYLGLGVGCLGWARGLAWAALAQIMGSFLLAIVFVQSHNAMEVYKDLKDFITAQIVSTRNIAPSPFNDWFTGGLNFQIEHHLFPTMPRHNLSKTANRVRQLCVRHGLAYESCSFRVGTYKVVARLAHIAAQI